MTRSTTDKIDPEMLISLVQCRPGLWDKSLEHHKDFDQRSAAWTDICRILCPEYDKLNRKDKHMYVKTVVKKWTNIRDAWRKSIADSKNKKKTKLYLYHENLKFLEKNLNKQVSVDQNAESNLTKQPEKPATHSEDIAEKTDKFCLDYSDDASDSMTVNESEYSLNRGIVRKRRTGELRESETNIHFMDVKNLDNRTENNPHLCFVRGLLPMLDKLDDDETLEFQVGVIQLLQDLRKRAKSDSEPWPHNELASSSIDLNIKEENDV